MTKARLDGLYLLLLGSAVFLLLGVALEIAAPAPMADFKSVYYGARCLVQHVDPYSEAAFLHVYKEEGGDRASDPVRVRRAVSLYINAPTTLALLAPIAALPWRSAHILWTILSVGCLIFASFLIWNLSADSAPVVSGFLIGFLLANSETLVIMANTAAVAIALCVAAVWCFLQERFIPAGILCLAMSLAIKPHDAGLVWLFFLLAGGVYRKRALQTLVITVALSLPAILWVSHVAPHWMQEWHSNVLTASAHGDLNDPGPDSWGGHGLGMVISLQSVFSIFWDNPRIYNPVSHLVCAPFLLVWAFVTLRCRLTPARVWLALAAIAALSMLPVYHRQYDTKLLLLTVPACTMLWAEGGLVGWLALLVNSAGFVLTGDLPWAILLGLINNLRLPSTRLTRQMLMAVQVFPVPLILLVIGVFYLWVYVRRCPADVSSQAL
jgi:hypothetical protein